LPSLLAGDLIAYDGGGATLEDNGGAPLSPDQTHFVGILTGQRKTQMDQYIVFVRQDKGTLIRGEALLSSVEPAVCADVDVEDGDDSSSGAVNIFEKLAETMCTSRLLMHRPKPETLH
jgi:hypothetical protein